MQLQKQTTLSSLNQFCKGKKKIKGWLQKKNKQSKTNTH